MKTSCLAILLLSSIVAGAQTSGIATQTTTGQPALPAPTAYSVVENGPNHRVWERILYESGPNGTVVGRKHRVTELSTGLNFLQNGQWTPSREQIDLLPAGLCRRRHPRATFSPVPIGYCHRRHSIDGCESTTTDMPAGRIILRG